MHSLFEKDVRFVVQSVLHVRILREKYRNFYIRNSKLQGIWE